MKPPSKPPPPPPDFAATVQSPRDFAATAQSPRTFAATVQSARELSATAQSASSSSAAARAAESAPRVHAATMPLTPHVEWEPTSAGRANPPGFGQPAGFGAPPGASVTHPMGPPHHAPWPAPPTSASFTAAREPPPASPSMGRVPTGPWPAAQPAHHPYSPPAREEPPPPSTNTGSMSQVTGPQQPSSMPLAYVVASAVFLAIAVVGFGLYLALEVF